MAYLGSTDKGPLNGCCCRRRCCRRRRRRRHRRGEFFSHKLVVEVHTGQCVELWC